MLSRRSQLAIELEAISGTAETLEAADVIRVFEPKFSPKLESNKRKPAQASLSNLPTIPGGRSGEFTFNVELVGATGAGIAVHYADALKACGFGETLVVSTSATYLPISTGIPTATIALYQDGKIYKGWGCAGTVKLLLERGKPGMLQFTFQCADWSETDGALLTGVSYAATLPPIFTSAALTIDSYPATVSKTEIDIGNKVTLRPDANSSSGYKTAVITDRDPSLSFDPENVLVATEDYFGNWRSGAQMAFTTTLGSAAGNTIVVTAPKVQFNEVGLGDKDGVSGLEITADLAQNAGDDELQIQII